MEKIGEGLQYVVYDLGDEVKKEPKSQKEMEEYLREFHDSEEQVKRLAKRGLDRRQEVNQRLKGKNFSMLADFKFKDGTVFQKKLKIVKEALEDAESLADKKSIIDAYIKLLKQCWIQGFHDMSYNFTLNTGLDEDGNLLQLDLGDLIFSKHRVKKEVEDQKWLKESASYTEHLKEDIKPYYKRKMANEINLENLDKLWRAGV